MTERHVPNPEQGRIVWLETCDPQGRNLKKRPAVIVTPTSEIEEDKPIVCVAITTDIPHVQSEDFVLLPYQNGGHPRTGLSKRCAAMCSWLVVIREDEIIGYLGKAPKPQLELILARME
jgi:mRNA-degrading endonuclease toxin of MazEF toxin-antitoxin module